MNLRRGLRRITVIFAILVGIICGTTATGILIEKRSSALRHLGECEIEFIGSIPVADPNARPAGWPEWSSERYRSFSAYLEKVSWFLVLKQVNLPILTGEEDKEFRKQHNIPPDSHDRFYTDESVEFMRTYGKCIEKAGFLLASHRRFGVGLSTTEIVLGGLGCAIAGFCGIWLLYAIIDCLVVPLVFWVSKGFHKDSG